MGRIAVRAGRSLKARELVYTGITRARHWFTMARSDGGQGVLDLADGRQVRRTGGLLGPAGLSG